MLLGRYFIYEFNFRFKRLQLQHPFKFFSFYVHSFLYNVFEFFFLFFTQFILSPSFFSHFSKIPFHTCFVYSFCWFSSSLSLFTKMHWIHFNFFAYCTFRCMCMHVSAWTDNFDIINVWPNSHCCETHMYFSYVYFSHVCEFMYHITHNVKKLTKKEAGFDVRFFFSTSVLLQCFWVVNNQVVRGQLNIEL